jgi:lipopolysaccharide assembly outer membrane protein LptD (OstA)
MHFTHFLRNKFILRTFIKLYSFSDINKNLVFGLLALSIFSFNTSFAQRPALGGGNRPIGNFGNFGAPTTSAPTTNNSQSKSRIKRPKIKKDTLSAVIPDSLRSLDNEIETTVQSMASDSTVLDVETQIYHLYGNAEVVYGDIELKADYIKLDWGQSEVYAHGMPDTTKKVGEKVKGKPIFIDKGETFNSDTIRYNFKSKKAIVYNIVTQQGEGYVQGKKVKKDEEDNMYLSNAKYTTCNLKEPHFHIAARKIKLVDKKSLVSGPFNLVLNDIPLPIGLPMGFFPIPKKKEIGTSGFVMGNYGEEPRNRGYFFRDFGYYHAFNEYVGAKLLAQVYSKGSWGVGLQSTYTKKYKFAGNLNLQFNLNKSGEIIPQRGPSRDFNVSWSHSPQNRRPDRSFSANVNLVSNSFNRNNRRLDELDQYTNNTFGSSIQYSKSFGKLIRTSTGFRVDQNVSTKVLNSSLDYTFGLNQFNPFVKEKNQVGNWYDAFRVGLDLSGGFRATNNLTERLRSTSYTDFNIVGVENRPLTNEELRQQSLGRLNNQTVRPIQSLEDVKYILSELGQFRTSFSIPVALPNFKLARYINFTPGFSYRGDIYTKRLNYTYFEEQDAVKIDTLSAREENVPFFTSGTWSTSGNLNTRIYGTYKFGKKGRLQGIRHTMAPSLGISYNPDLSKNPNLYQKVRLRADDVSERFMPRFTELGPANGASGSINFSVSNQLEAKLKSKSDTAEKEFQKVSLLDNLNFGTSYNLFAFKQQFKYNSDTISAGFNLANFNLGANTSLFKNLINLNFNANIDPYTFVEDTQNKSNLAGRRVPVYKWKHDGYAGSYLNFVNVSISTSISPDKFKKNAPKNNQNTSKDPSMQAMKDFVQANPLAYVDFSIPWSINLSYNLNYSKQGLAPSQVTQAFQFTGDLSLTPKWKLNYSSGWDFVFKSVTLTTVGIIRELHCWDMSFNWTPIAGNNLRASNYSFTIQPRSSLLRDLKISRRRAYFDRGGF